MVTDYLSDWCALRGSLRAALRASQATLKVARDPEARPFRRAGETQGDEDRVLRLFQVSAGAGEDSENSQHCRLVGGVDLLGVESLLAEGLGDVELAQGVQLFRAFVGDGFDEGFFALGFSGVVGEAGGGCGSLF